MLSLGGEGASVDYDGFSLTLRSNGNIHYYQRSSSVATVLQAAHGMSVNTWKKLAGN